MTNITTIPRVAIVIPHYLGDSLLFLIIAYQLSRAGYDITYYSDYALELRDWIVENIKLKRLSDKNLLETSEWAGYDMILAHISVINHKSYKAEQEQQIADRFVFFNVGKFTPYQQNFLGKALESLKRRVWEPKLFAKLLPLAKVDGALLHQFGMKKPFAYRVCCFCKEVLGIQEATTENGLAPNKALNLQPKKYNKRVIIHPTSNEALKDWPVKKFIALAKKLKKVGFDPVFITSPKERFAFQKIEKMFLMPVFSSVGELAKFIYESAYFIGTDSGIGHLASNLGISTLTILKSKNQDFRWRPGWSPSKVITPRLVFKWQGKYYWKLFTSVNRVFEAFLTQIEY